MVLIHYFIYIWISGLDYIYIGFGLNMDFRFGLYICMFWTKLTMQEFSITKIFSIEVIVFPTRHFMLTPLPSSSGGVQCDLGDQEE